MLVSEYGFSNLSSGGARTMNSKIILFCGVVAGFPLAANACDYGYCWGAVGFGPNGITGYAVRQGTVPDAEAQVRAACGDKCTVIEVFNDTCAALAADVEGRSYIGLDEDEFAAREEAQENCEATNDYCVIRVAACSK